MRERSPAVASRRREALRAAALGAGAFALGALARPRPASAQDTDAEELRDFLARAIAREQIAVLGYATASEAAGVDARLKATLERLRDHEQAHANAFRTALDDLGYDPPDPPDDPDDAAVFEDVDGLGDEQVRELSDLLATIGEAKTSKEFLRLLVELERGQIAFYAEAAAAVENEDLATTSAEIAAAQAQHLVVLGAELEQDPLVTLAALPGASPDGGEANGPGDEERNGGKEKGG